MASDNRINWLITVALTGCFFYLVLVRFIYDQYLAEHQSTAIEETPGELVP